MSRMKAVDFTKVRLTDGFWMPRQKANAEVTVWIQYEHLVSTGRIAGIDPEYKPGDHSAHHIFWDSDIAKWIETAAYSLSTKRDAELEAKVDAAIDLFAKCQRPDGYLNSWYNAVEPEKRWTNLRDCHELYCAGHMMEAAVAYYLATAKSKYLDMMCRYADHIDTTFGREEGKRRGYCGHEEIELALIKLYHVTGNEKYLRLAKYFIDERGSQPHYYDIEARERGEDPGQWYFRTYEYNQSHLPVRRQTRVVGHAVRAMYLYSGMADVANETGDEEIVKASEALWENVCGKQMYVIGGIGPSRHNEGFTFDYDMPEESAYCETCAAIGLTFWNHRLLQMTGDSKYADVMERALYNGTISGVSLSGDRFFYVNPLASMGDHHREEWFGCACCPGNISRMIASFGQYAYSESEDTAWVHLYVQGSGELSLAGSKVVVSQTTDYPWKGAVVIDVSPAEPKEFTLAVRIPGWCRKASVVLNGTPVETADATEKGYLMIRRLWSAGDKVALDLPMPVEFVSAHPAVRQANGKVVLQRGPVVYCLEEADNPTLPLTRLSVSRGASFDCEYEPGLLGGVVTLSANAEAICATDQGSKLYDASEPVRLPARIKAVPYCVWDNRSAGQMLVWLRES